MAIQINEKECAKIKQQLIIHLEKHRVPIEVADNGNVIIAGVVTCKPPYNINSCFSTNDIVLGRIHSILKTFDPL